MSEQAPKKKLTKQQKRMRAIVARFQAYVSTYTDQEGYDKYQDKTFLDDMIYGLGIAIGSETASDYTGPGGYERFKQTLREFLK